MRYLGKYRAGNVVVQVFLDARKGIVVTVLTSEGKSVVQAWTKLVLRGGEVRKGDLERLLFLVSGHGANLEFQAGKATRAQVERLEPPSGGAKWVESALWACLKDLEKAKQEHETFRGVRDLEDAEQALQERGEEIFDLNQKIVGGLQEPHFIRRQLTQYTTSAWHATDRMRHHELRSQAKAASSKLRQRIDFSLRQRVTDLESKRRDLQALLKEERSRERQRVERIRKIVEDSHSVLVALALHSPARVVQGRRGAAVEAAVKDVEREAIALRGKLEKHLGLRFAPAGEEWLLSSWLPDPEALRILGMAGSVDAAAGLAAKKSLEKDVAGVLASLLERQHVDDAPDLARFPTTDAGKKRLAYLGLALTWDLNQTRVPVFLDLDEQGPRHTAVCGGSGSGKSVAASLIVEGALLHDVPVLVFDPTRSWTGFNQPCTQKRLLNAYPDYGLKPAWSTAFPTRIEGADVDAETLLAEKGLHILAGEADQAAQVEALLKRVYDEIQAWSESRELRMLLVFEEAHRYMSDKRLQPVLEQFARTARARGVGLLIVSQVAVDLPPAIRSNTATKIQLQTSYAQDLLRAAQSFGSDYRALVPRLKQGAGVVHYPEFGSCLVAFRPPLHSPYVVEESVLGLQTGLRNLEEVVGRLTRHIATGDTQPTAGEEAVEEAQGGLPGPAGARHATGDAKTWQDVASRFLVRCEGKPKARDVLNAIRAVGMESPSLRTVQRWLSSHQPE